MKKSPFLLVAIFLTIVSCSKDESTQEEESARLDKMYQEIVAYSQVNSTPCSNPDEWTFMKLDPSGCTGYLIYNKKIDVAIFQKKIEQYLNARGKHDAKWGIYYDCLTTPPPTKIECVNDKPTLTYSIASN